MPLKRSEEYRKTRTRVIDRKPMDGWHEAGLHYFVFHLFPAADGAAPGADAQRALFAMRPRKPAPVAAVLITPGGQEVGVVYLREPERSYLVPLDDAGGSGGGAGPA